MFGFHGTLWYDIEVIFIPQKQELLQICVNLDKIAVVHFGHLLSNDQELTEHRSRFKMRKVYYFSKII